MKGAGPFLLVCGVWIGGAATSSAVGLIWSIPIGVLVVSLIGWLLYLGGLSARQRVRS